MDAPNESLRGKTIKAVFEVLEVKKLELPQLTPALLEELGGFGFRGGAARSGEGAARAPHAIRATAARAREQVLAALTVAADWDLPPEMLRRQARRELERSVLELRRSGFSDAEIAPHENELRQNSSVSTARALKEHFILERIAEDEKIEDLPEDYDLEIELIAQQTGESARRTRGAVGKAWPDGRLAEPDHRAQGDRPDSLARQVQGRSLQDGRRATPRPIDQTLGGEEEEADIPEAKHSGGAESLKQPQERG